MKTQTVSLAQLIVRLAQVRGATPIGFSALIDARAKKTGNPFGDISKLSRVSAFTGFDYENAVNRQQTREGGPADFEAKARSWGERCGPALVEKDGTFYLVAKVEKTRKPVYLVRRNGFLSPVAKELVSPFLPVVKSSAAAQGVEKEVVYRNYKLSNLVSINIGGESLRIRQPHGQPS